MSRGFAGKSLEDVKFVTPRPLQTRGGETAAAGGILSSRGFTAENGAALFT